MELGRVGVWSGQFRTRDAHQAAEAAAELEQLGFGALWIPGGAGGDILGDVDRAIAATDRMVVATGILNVWMHDPAEVAARHADLSAAAPDRFLLGLGVSHASLVEQGGRLRYKRPLRVMRHYLDRLDAAEPPVPRSQRVLAALGPRMLELARDRTAGAHPYLSDPSHTATARQALGAGPLLAPEQMVVLATDPDDARSRARQHLARYLELPNYTRNLRRLGYSEEDVTAPGTDHLIDGIVAWGDVGAIADRICEHLDAGADHVCVQVLGEDPTRFPRPEWRELSAALPGLRA